MIAETAAVPTRRASDLDEANGIGRTDRRDVGGRMEQKGSAATTALPFTENRDATP